MTVVDDPLALAYPLAAVGRRQGRRLRRPHPPGPAPAQHVALLVRQRQPPQGAATNAVQIAEELLKVSPGEARR